jgi:transcriptional regulator with XRE-family HTH domain
MMQPAPNPIGIRFGRNLRRKRDRVGMTQARLAELAGLHRTAIARLEKGERTPRMETTFRLAGALGVSPAALLAGITWEPDGAGGGTYVVSGELIVRG